MYRLTQRLTLQVPLSALERRRKARLEYQELYTRTHCRLPTFKDPNRLNPLSCCKTLAEGQYHLCHLTLRLLSCTCVPVALHCLCFVHLQEYAWYASQFVVRQM